MFWTGFVKGYEVKVSLLTLGVAIFSAHCHGYIGFSATLWPAFEFRTANNHEH